MKKLILACTFLASTTMVTFAQSAATASPGVEKMATARAQTFQKKLGLTKEQYTAVYNAEVNYYKQEEMAKANGGTGAGQAYQMQVGRDNQYKNVLTPEQYTKYEAASPKPSMPGMAPASH